MSSESPIEITLTPEGSNLAVIVDFHDIDLNEKRLEQLSTQLSKEIQNNFSPVEVGFIDAQYLSEGTTTEKQLEETSKSKGLGEILIGAFKVVLKKPQALASLLPFLVDRLAQKAILFKVKQNRKYLEIKILGFEESEILFVIASVSSMAQQMFESKN